MIPKEIFEKCYRGVEKFTNVCYNASSSINLNLYDTSIIVLLQLHVRSVYKELHADRETGC